MEGDTRDHDNLFDQDVRRVRDCVAEMMASEPLRFGEHIQREYIRSLRNKVTHH